MNELKPFRCLKCNASFGMTDGVRLYCGEIAIFTLKVTPTCKICGEHRTWRPVALEKKFADVPVITTEKAKENTIVIVYRPPAEETISVIEKTISNTMRA
jgi:hypothetical protein